MKVSYCLFTYNQALFVHEALRSAFSQDYSPLEIVIIDDGSMDGTAEIIQAKVAEYSGPHRIKLLLKQTNKGFADSVNAAIYDLADGEWLIFAAGDDISLNDRVTKISALANSDPTLTLIQSGVSSVDARGGHLADIQPPRLDLQVTMDKSVLGAAAAYSRHSVSVFPRISARVIREDVVLTTRSLIYGNYGRHEGCLVKWRRHENNMSGKYGKGFFERVLFSNGRFLNDHSIALIQQMSDVTHAMMRGDLDDEKCTELLLLYGSKLRQNQKRSKFFSAFAEGKTEFTKFIRYHPLYSIYGLTLLLSLYARENTFILRNWLTGKRGRF